jgi:pimeloyl-ACP methyl ester carboxylesterase
MEYTHSADGTRIAFERTGDGPPLVLVDGALCYTASGPSRPLAAELADRFTVFCYDRRGRGESGDTLPYAVEREVEDICALVDEAGGSAYLYGISSGAALALRAAASGLRIDGLALYEPPFALDPDARRARHEYRTRLDDALAQDRRGDAVRLFMRLVGLPRVVVALMRFLPSWRRLTAVAHTLPYDYAALADDEAEPPVTAQRWAGAGMPALVVAGGKSPADLLAPARALADVLPNARHRILAGQTHLVSPKALAPVLTDFFAGCARRAPGQHPGSAEADA